MKPAYDISIITVNYNGFQDTCEMIASIQANLHSCTYELIVVDNGSQQNEAMLIQQVHPNVKTIRSEKNTGFAGGNNIGISEAQGKYIFLLNNDTLIQEDKLHLLIHQLDKHPEIGAISPKIKFAFPPYNIQYAGFTAFSKYTLRNKGIGFNKSDKGQYDSPYPTSFLHGAALLFRREILDKVGKMPEIYFLYYEEMDWCNHIAQAGFQLWYNPRFTVYHKESSTTGHASPLKTYYLTRNRLLYAYRNQKGYPFCISLLYQLILANPKNIIVNLLKGKIQQTIAIFKGSTDFFALKNKML